MKTSAQVRASVSYNLERISACLRGHYEWNLLYLLYLLLENVPRRHENLCETPDGFYRMYVDQWKPENEITSKSEAFGRHVTTAHRYVTGLVTPCGLEWAHEDK